MDFHPFSTIHQQTFNNASRLDEARQCACIFCLSTYPPSDIAEFWDKGTTAVCPRCGIDSVIFDIDVPQLDRSLLRTLRHYAWNGYFDELQGPPDYCSIISN